jgi:hypothetical protein
MNNNIKFLFAFLILPFILNGCYTVLWTPDDDLPNDSSYINNNSYYIDDYHYYYDYPWWLTFTPPVRNRGEEIKHYEREGNITSIRNNGSGRNSDSEREVLNTPPPTKSYTPLPSETDKSSKSSDSNSNTNTRQSSGSNENNVRNNDGNRNNGRGR